MSETKGNLTVPEESTLKPNSHAYKKEQESKPPKLKAVAKGSTTPDKGGTLGDKLARTFIKEDTQSVGEYLLFDVLVPAAKNAISDMVSTGVNMLLFGENRPIGGIKRNGDSSYVSYNNYYRGNRRYSSSYDDPFEGKYATRGDVQRRETRKFDQVEVPSRQEAEQVLNALVDRTILYGIASVADLYDLAGVPSVYTDNDWGWDSLEGSRIERTRHGYVIRVPQPHLLEE